jgi:Spy/CpxP family protein refolding chaperone
MNRISSALGVALAIGISITASVLADSSHAPGDTGGGKRQRRFEEALQLTDAQKEQMKALHQGQHGTMRDEMKEMRQAHEDLRKAVFADKPDNDQIEALKAKLNGLQAQMLSAHVDQERKFAAILTPEQRQKVATMPPRHFGGHGHHHHHHEGPDAPDGPEGEGGH